jgi:phage terminase large subunit GpA-like protein
VKGYRRHQWQKMRERNEALDCRVYARAAASRIGLDRYQEKNWRAIEERMGVSKAPSTPPSSPVPSAPTGSRPQPRAAKRRTWGRFSM